MFVMWLTALLGVFDPISRITKSITNAKIAATKASTDEERIHSEERVSMLQARRDIMLRESSGALSTWTRAGFAWPFILYNAKVIVWDNVLGLGVTRWVLPPDMLKIEMICISFYFLYEGVSRFRRR